MTHSVLVVGAGPVGLTMAAELARHGIHCRIIDSLLQPSPYCRALSVTTRTLEIWEDMGILKKAMDAGIWITGKRIVVPGRSAQEYTEDLTDFPYAHASLSIPQPVTENILTQYLESYGLRIERGMTLTSLTQNGSTVSVELQSANGKTEETQFRYVVGCDGAHSFVRRAVGIAFEGEMLPFEFMLGDVQMDWSLPRGYSFQSLTPVANAAPKFFVAIPLPEPNRYRISMIAPSDLVTTTKGTIHGVQSERAAPNLKLLQAQADQLVGETVRLSDLRWSSIFRISIRLASSYQSGQVFLAGDAAHIHPPTGGQGMNTGIQDAYNLAWKMALVLKGKSPETLLESYTMERREEGKNVITRSMQASMNTGPAGFKTDRLADTQLLVSYRNSSWVAPLGEEGWTSNFRPGDRAPDCQGLRRTGVGYPFRLFDLLQGTAHVMLIDLQVDDERSENELYSLTERLRAEFGEEIYTYLRVVVICQNKEERILVPGFTWIYDPDRSFAAAYGSKEGTYWLIRPDGYICWCGLGLNTSGLFSYLNQLFNFVAQQL